LVTTFDVQPDHDEQVQGWVPENAAVLPQDVGVLSGGPDPASLSETRQGQKTDGISDGYSRFPLVSYLRVTIQPSAAGVSKYQVVSESPVTAILGNGFCWIGPECPLIDALLF
jgi:hypothetical protein